MLGPKLCAVSTASCAVIWGFIGICTKTLSDAGMDSVQINTIRSTVCLIAITVVLLAVNRKLFSIRAKDLWILILTAVTKVMIDVLYIHAQTTIGLSMAGVLLSTNCYFALALSYLLFRDRIPARRILAAAIGFSGCALAVGVFSGVGELEVLGICVGLGAGLGEALHAATFKLSIERNYSESTVLFYVFLFSTAMLIPFSNPSEIISAVSGDSQILAVSLAIGLVFTALPYYLYSKGLEGLDIGTVSIIMFLETATASILGFAVFGEPLTVFTAAGIAMIFVSVVIMNYGYNDKNAGRRGTG